MRALEHILSADELSRAGRFHFQTDRDHFIAARGLLRSILGMYLKRDPSHLTFCFGPNGKPSIKERTNAKALRFNASHSEGLALFAVALDREVGVDIEYIRPDLSVCDLVAQACSRGEAESLNLLPEHSRLEALYTLWTRKEAYLKAQGTGLTNNLTDIEVIGSPGDLAETIEIRDTQRGTSWILKDLDVAPGFAATLAIERGNLHVRCWQWESEL
ncbi:MAG TPA: 4'-phosphopantetheinyl transferase superfamily protein [Thermodesulfovibrionales bacterium]|nr:4'-phosphopantetheinyl transferase superfamily protein [Thermodesulfovibrionales bacterium]